ncbi:hypothetical protein GMES_3933 [Paraglaciecola mesophila KMM 241]|uniref:Uncharacterized protein n=1 Tax=Paraglaciecola mesophila KMM 241 TaxID=1128912 RepID=K6YQD4_9ALTE|nr:hypothetical protein GMES_3933 [Paraglaciecola mesophila KMM 241]
MDRAAAAHGFRLKKGKDAGKRSACFALFTDSSHPEHRRLTLVRLPGAI